MGTKNEAGDQCCKNGTGGKLSKQEIIKVSIFQENLMVKFSLVQKFWGWRWSISQAGDWWLTLKDCDRCSANTKRKVLNRLYHWLCKETHSVMTHCCSNLCVHTFVLKLHIMMQTKQVQTISPHLSLNWFIRNLPWYLWTQLWPLLAVIGPHLLVCTSVHKCTYLLDRKRYKIIHFCNND